MTTTKGERQFSDEKIVMGTEPETSNSGDEKKGTMTRDADAKVSGHWDGAEVSSHWDEKSSLAATDAQGETTSALAANAPSPAAAEEKQLLSRESDKISTARSEELAARPGSELTPTSRSQTDSSWSQFASTSYQEHSFCHVNALRLNHNIIINPDGRANYFIEVSGFTKGREDVLIRRIGNDFAGKGSAMTAEEGKTCPIAAFAQFPHGRDHFIQLAIGEPTDMRGVRWLDLSRTSENEDWRLFMPGKPGQTFQLATNAELSSPTNSSAQVSPLDNKSSTGSFKFIDTDSRAMLAAYTELKTMSSWKKRGKLRLYERALASVDGADEEELQLLIILCCAVMNEKRRRKTVRKWAGMGVV